MFKKLLFAVAAMVMMMGAAFADVDVNKADQAALDGIKGIGPAKSKAIIAERSKNGTFKDWSDFETRVKGIGDKNSVKLSAAGLTVNGQPKPGTAPKVNDKVNEKVNAKPVKADAGATSASAASVKAK
ncbi:ComEA family DNA-binding protein [Undibacterium sp. SXout20W]|uniref:ComEA family DNA-binding protein n=1 Tax=Undibacterium sp. SXout20W TaxID=3413051 RepID=UPI003BEF6835